MALKLKKFKSYFDLWRKKDVPINPSERLIRPQKCSVRYYVCI